MSFPPRGPAKKQPDWGQIPYEHAMQMKMIQDAFTKMLNDEENEKNVTSKIIEDNSKQLRKVNNLESEQFNHISMAA